MKHLKSALDKFNANTQHPEGNLESPFVHLDSTDNSVKFIIQSAPVKEVGVNGIQATDILKFTRFLFTSLNSDFYCAENLSTIRCIEDAIKYQNDRTHDRVLREVEGTNQI